MSFIKNDIIQYTSTGNKAPLRIPSGYKRINVRLECTSSTAKIQTTVYPDTVVEADPSAATWRDWDAGDITTSHESRLVGAASYIRVVVDAGTDVKLIIRMDK